MLTLVSSFKVNPFNVFEFGLTGVFLFIDGIVYWFVSQLFKIFNSLASFEIVDQGVYNALAQRIEVVIGVAMLFFVASSLLKSLVDPDNLNKNTAKIAKNAIISIILLGVVPVIFEQAMHLQNIIIENRVVEKLLLGSGTNGVQETPDVATLGNEIALNTLEVFLNIPDSMTGEGDILWSDLKENSIMAGGNFTHITAFVEPVHDKTEASNGETVEYMPIVSTACGLFLIYVLISFCIDLGIRIVKLAFYQILAPIPILMYIIPEKKSVFDNWVKATLATYLEVFIRLFVMFAVVFLCKEFTTSLAAKAAENGTRIFSIESIIIVMGIFAFAKQAPKLIGDVIGVDSGNMKLGIGGKLAAAGIFGGAIGAIGGLATAGVQGITHGFAKSGTNWKEFNKNKNLKNFGKAVGSTLFHGAGGVLSGATGGISAGARGMKGGWGKKVGEAKKAGRDSASNVRSASLEREGYRARHGGYGGAALGRVGDAFSNFTTWATGGAAGILSKVQYEEEFKGGYDDIQAIYENASYKAMDNQLEQYKAMQKAGNTSLQDGTDLADAIKTLEGNMLKARIKALQDNSQASAYAMYNIAQNAKRDPELAKQIGIDISMVDNLQLNGNRVLDKNTGKEVEAQQLFEMFEGTALEALRGASYNKATDEFIDSSGMVIDFTAIGVDQDSKKNGLRHQKKKATTAINADKVSIDYKEALKRKEANDKK